MTQQNKMSRVSKMLSMYLRKPMSNLIYKKAVKLLYTNFQVINVQFKFFPQDIRSYFLSSGNNKKKDSNEGNSKDEISVKPQKRQLVLLDSDSEEDPMPKEVKKHRTNPVISRE